MTADLSIMAAEELAPMFSSVLQWRIILPKDITPTNLLGTDADRARRNRLQSRWMARKYIAWFANTVQLRCATTPIPQGMLIVRDAEGNPLAALSGAVALTTDGLGLAPGNPMAFTSETDDVQHLKSWVSWFEDQWSTLPQPSVDSPNVLDSLNELVTIYDPQLVYNLILHHLLSGTSGELDEDRIVNADTGIRNTTVWKKLYKFQRDGVVGGIDKLNRYGGCIIADSVGLGKTFEALAIIKYHELRNDRVLVLCPKRLRDNWTMYTSNDRRNILAADRFHYDVLNHTDLTRDDGYSGDIDLAHVNWGNYDLVVIDESHNFRNKKSPHAGGETRYDRLMRKIIREGVKTRVLMLSATPVNNRLADLRNQIAFATEGNDAALSDHGVTSIDATTRRAQKQFNSWLKLPEAERTPVRLIEMLGFDYFTLLDTLTIARSRRHIEKYYGITETGRFPDRLKPMNIKADVDLSGSFDSIATINREIRRLTLASYAPLRYVLAHKKEAYNSRYSNTARDGTVSFQQADREESLIQLMRINLLKRMESAVPSFVVSVERLLQDVESMLQRVEAHSLEIEELDLESLELDDPMFESLVVGNKIKVLLSDVDLVRWKQDLNEDRKRLLALVNSSRKVDAGRDAKLAALKTMIVNKCNNPINPGNRKVIVFTAFADTARYLYNQLATFSKESLGIETALITGSGSIQTTLPGLRKDLTSILTAFSPRSKERPADMAEEGEIDLLIATDCISEGQNLQDCDWLINYDIHWNPVRIIQRFGRIDRLGSPNERIQLVNLWPNMELEEYINLEQRVSGRMVLLDISATGEENLIEQQSGDPMNDLEYRRKQLLKLQDTVIDLEDLSTGVSIADLTLTDFRIDVAEYRRANPGLLDALPVGTMGVTSTTEADIPPGIIFCLRAEGEAATRIVDQGYPLSPYYLVHVGDDGAVLLPYTQAKHILDRLKRASLGCDHSDSSASIHFDKVTKQGEDMHHAQRLLAAAVASIVGKTEERAIASLFTPGGTHALDGEFAGMDDFEVLAMLVILPEASR